MADLVYVFLTLMFFGGCAVLAGLIERRRDLHAAAPPAAAALDTDAGGQQ